MNDTDALLSRCERAQRAADSLLRQLLGALRTLLHDAEGSEADALQFEQARAHGVAWAATYVRALQQMLAWAQRLRAAGRCGELETLLLHAAFGEYLAQLAGGLPMSQGEMFRAEMLAANGSALAAFNADADVRRLRAEGFGPPLRRRIATLLAEGAATRRFGDPGYDDAALYEVREQFARFADDHAEAAHRWHLGNELIPDEVVADTGRQLDLFGGASLDDERAARALARVQGLLGPDAVGTAVVVGGRSPADSVRIVPWGDDRQDVRGKNSAERGAPWPGSLPGPLPCEVFPYPQPVEVHDADGRAVQVSGRMAINAPPAVIMMGDRTGALKRVGVVAWAGPWPVDERWWDGTAHRRRARFQLQTDQGVCLAVIEGGQWWIEATWS